jgi:hypothetical protein
MESAGCCERGEEGEKDDGRNSSKEKKIFTRRRQEGF